jgi:hypothetical protein
MKKVSHKYFIAKLKSNHSSHQCPLVCHFVISCSHDVAILGSDRLPLALAAFKVPNKGCFFQKVQFIFQISKSSKINVPKNYPELEI